MANKTNTKRNDTLILTKQIIVRNKFQEDTCLLVGTPVKYLRTLPVSKLILVRYRDTASTVMFDVEASEVSGYVND